MPSFDLYPFPLNTFLPAIKLALMSPEERFSSFYVLFNLYPNNVKIWLGPKMLIAISNPDNLHKIFFSSECLEKWNFMYQIMDRNNGLIAGSTKNKWREHRKFFNYSFSAKMLKSYITTYVDYSLILCDNLLSKANGEEYDFLPILKNATFNVLCTTMLGINLRLPGKREKLDDVYKAFET